MELSDGKGGVAHTSHASKQSKISLKIVTLHTSAMLPLMSILIYPKLITLKVALFSVLVLILLERRGWTLGLAFKRLRSKWAGKRRYRTTKQMFHRRVKINK